MAQKGGREDRPRAEVPGEAVVSGDHVELQCWPDHHWIGDVRPGSVLRLWDRRCKKYVLFRMDELLRLLKEAEQAAA